MLWGLGNEEQMLQVLDNLRVGERMSLHSSQTDNTSSSLSVCFAVVYAKNCIFG